MDIEWDRDELRKARRLAEIDGCFGYPDPDPEWSPETRNVFRLMVTRCRKDGIPFDPAVISEVGPEPDNCPCCGQLMVRGKEGGRMTSPSLDRLVPEQGYVPGNVIWVCMKCNTTKSNHTLDEIYRVADFYYELYRERGIPCSTRLRPKEDRDD